MEDHDALIAVAVRPETSIPDAVANACWEGLYAAQARGDSDRVKLDIIGAFARAKRTLRAELAALEALT